MTNRQRIPGVDTAWLRMDHPTNLMMIVGVLMFDGRLGLGEAKRAIASRFLAFRRFRQRAVQDATGAWWEDAPGFSIDDHVLGAALPAPCGKAQLEALVSELASTPLDPARPLWQFHLVERCGGGSALIARIHHCYADGIALVRVMLSLTHETAAGSRAATRAAHGQGAAEEDTDSLATLLRPFTRAVAGAASAGRELLGQGLELAIHPQRAAGAAQEAARQGASLAAEIARLALMGPDAATRFKGPLGVRKRVAWADTIPLEETKAVARALGCSINDVLLSTAAGALRDYLLAQGDAVDGLEIRAIVPVNLRPPDEAHGLGNRFGLVFMDLPIGIEHPLERLYTVRARMRSLKGSWQPAIALALLGAVGIGPRALQAQVTALLSSSASAVVTNVPGPARPLYFAGRKIAALDFWVPQSGGIGMGLSILSYAGKIQFGVITDAGLVPDPSAIAARFGVEFEKLLWVTLMCPWGEETFTSP